jgi:2-polyprenyl-6-methoxyphenol hydroxylase-like FAD-dependent oxidoreductase
MAPEIAIIGGGPAGLALAAILEKSNIDYIVYERSSEQSQPRGGCLDLHVGIRQRAMYEAGVFDEFRMNSRDGDATIHLLYDHQGTKLLAFGEGRDAPEVDRWQLRNVLLTGIPKHKIIWSKSVASSQRNEQVQIVLTFADGTRASGFKLVVGADGTDSKVRHLVSCLIILSSHSSQANLSKVTDAKPVYSGNLYITTKIHPNNPYYSAVETIGGVGSHVIMGNGKHMFNSRQGDGHYRIDVGLHKLEDFPTTAGIDFDDHDAVKNLLLQDEYFGSYAPEFKDIIRHSEGPFRPWLMYHMPTDRLNWNASEDVT